MMSTGGLIFISGIILLVLTIILAVIFWLKKPQYIPENKAVIGPKDKWTQRLRNGYPTDPLTQRREQPRPQSGAVRFSDQTEILTSTEKLEMSENPFSIYSRVDE